jgi:HD-like signal output (HDOD) protein
MLQCAIAARRVAQETTAVDPDEAFLAGMFCHVGQLVMHRRDPETFQQVLNLSQGNEGRVLDIERGLFAFSHEMIGAVLLELWNFSPLQVQTVLHHHDFAEAAGLSDEVRSLAATVNVAATLCQPLSSPPQDAVHKMVLNCPGRQLLHLSSNQLATLQQDLANL